MKHYIFIILTFIIFSCKAQIPVNLSTYNSGDNSNKYFKDIDHNYDNFVGVWESTTNNITFRLTLWKENFVGNQADENCYMDEIHGKYLIISNANTPNEQIIYNSIKYFPQSNTTSNSIIIAFAMNGDSFGGSYTETNAENDQSAVHCAFSLDIIDGTNNLQANWKLKPFANENISIPTPLETILHKVN